MLMIRMKGYDTTSLEERKTCNGDEDDDCCWWSQKEAFLEG
jgi:hypothetical protein